MRKATVVLALLAVLAVFAAVAVPRLVSMESFRPRVVAAIEGKTGRAVSFSGITLSLFPSVGIRLSEFALSGPPSRPGEPLVAAPVAELRMALPSLLAGRNEFATLLLSHPRITIRAYRDGTHSAADVLERLAAQDAAPPGGVAPPVTVALKSVHVHEGTLSVFTEEEGASDRRWDITPLSLRVSGIGGPGKPFVLSAGFSGAVRGEVRLEGTAVQRPASEGGGLQVHASGKVFGEKVAAEGILTGGNGIPEADLSFSFPKVEIARLGKAFPAVSSSFEGLRPKGIAKVSAKLSGDARSLGFELEADLTRAAWTVSEGLEKFIDSPCLLLVEGRRFPGVFSITNAELRYSPLLVTANASLSTATGAREWSASARLASLAEFARSRGGTLSKWAPDGRLVIAGSGRRASGAAGEAYRIDADLSGVGVVFPERGPTLSGFNGHVGLTPDAVEFSPLAGLVNGQRFHLLGKVSRLGAPVGSVELQMGYLDLDALFWGSGRGEERKKRGGRDVVPEWLADLRDRKLAFTAAVSIDAGDFWDVEFSRLSGRIRHEKGVLSFDGLRCTLYGGEMVLSGTLTGAGKGGGFSSKVVATNLDIGEIFRISRRGGDFLSGRTSFSGELSGSRTTLDEFLRGGVGSGTLRIADGKMKGVDLLALSSAVVGDGGKGSAGSGARGDTSFRELSADVSLEGGKARFNSLRILTGGMELSGDASVGLTDHTLEMLGTLWVPRAEASKAPWAGRGFSVSPRGGTAVPLVFSGTIHSPVVALDMSAIGRSPGRMLRTGPPKGGKR